MTELLKQDSLYIFLLCLSSISALLVIFLSARHFNFFFKHWTQPTAQNLSIRVMTLVPIWAVLSVVNVGMPQLRFIVAILLDLYESFAIYSFMQLIYHYLGGKEQAQWKALGKNPYRCCGCFCVLTPGDKMVQTLHFLVYQYVFIRPFMAIVVCVLYYLGLYEKGNFSKENITGVLTTGIVLISLFLAMWALFQLYRIFNVILKPYNVGSKFLAIKLYIFLHAVQGFVFGSIESNRSTEETIYTIVAIEYAITCLEMLVGALLNKYYFFNVSEYIDPFKDQSRERIRFTDDPLDP